MAVDHTQEDEVQRMVAMAVGHCRSLNILVNNVAGTHREFQATDRDIVTMPVEVWDRAMATNLRSPMLTCKHTVPKMIAAGCGSIVDISSGGHGGGAALAAYAGSKIGQHRLTMAIVTAYGTHRGCRNAMSPR
ncbi:SDR family NAD(P)-dependent oxidoreductase [Novosphingobium sp. HBC54]|uniref:SDR family NAD(P)-dependent oxidoreductase n=1 Tax=Novosphingobium cyanobacteriorum TaxID=3024215 RepID=A0ABT6CPK2_9SPHN|nr:SDR family NAD(P)-dependent oxidoreductase [Novosphingobium cyanobacteriorum]